ENLVRQDAKDAFNDGYTAPMAESTGKMNAGLEIKYRERKATESQNYASMSVNNNIALGKQQTSDDRTSFTEQYTLYGEKTAAQADQAFADIVNVGFQTEQSAGIGNILRSIDYDVEKGLSSENADQIFNDRYSAFGKMDGMLIKWNADVDPDAKKSILKTWDNFQRSMDGINSDSPNTAYAVSLATSNEVLSKAKSGEYSFDQLQKNGEAMKKEYSDLQKPSALPLSKSQQESYEKTIELNNLEIDKRSYSQNIISTDKQTTHTLLQGGGEIELDGKTYKITADYMKNVIEGEFSRIGDVMKSSDVNSPEFSKAVEQSLNLTQRTGVRNKAIVAMSDSITGDGIFVSLDDVRKSTHVSGALNNTGTSNDLLQNTMFVAISQKHMAQFDAGTATEAETVMKINNELRAAKNGIFGQIQNGKFKTAFSDALELSADDWVDTTIETATRNSLMLRWAAQGGTYNTDIDSLKKWIDNNTVIVGGTGRAVANSFGDFFWGGSSKSTSAMTLKNSDGAFLSAGVYEDSISNIVDEYNEANPSSQIATNDLRVTSGYKGGKDANEGYWSINILKDGVLINIGDFTGQQLTMKSSSAKTEKNGEDANVTKLDGVTKIQLKPTEPNKFERIMMSKENNKHMAESITGYNKETKLWKPHGSLEGGTATLAYGHKLQPDEIESGTIYGIDYTDGITDAQAVEIFREDQKKVKNDLNRPDFDNTQMALIGDVLHRTGQTAKSGGYKDWKVFKSIESKDYAGAWENTADISWIDKKGNMRFYDTRNEQTFKELGIWDKVSDEAKANAKANQEAKLKRYNAKRKG
ncbi:MAG: hypothetical protein J7L08_01930, partial [Candidatus Aenigmarchaeota archaeon]|nr:hypothetical protein [Candidatus Aenigmarchaeota archaeon]